MKILLYALVSCYHTDKSVNLPFSAVTFPITTALLIVNELKCCNSVGKYHGNVPLILIEYSRFSAQIERIIYSSHNGHWWIRTTVLTSYELTALSLS